MGEGYYKDGKEVGIWKIFHENGQVLMVKDESISFSENEGEGNQVFKSDGSLVLKGSNHEYLQEFQSKVTFFMIKNN